MKLLDEIIALLSDSKGSLTDALLKTKILLHQAGKKDLAMWVTNELTGYPDDKKENVPDYRHVGMQVYGHVIGYNMEHRSYPLPILHLKRESRERLTLCIFTESISNIEGIIADSHIKDGKKGQLHRPLPVEFGAQIKKVLTPGTHVISAWCEINMLQVENIVIQVRSRLLDFTLELNEAIGGDLPLSELPAKAEEVQTSKIFAQTILATGGTNNFFIGNQAVQITNQQGDLNGLIEEVKKLGYEQKDLDELRQAVQDDENDGKKPDGSEGKTAGWFGKAVKEASKGVVKVGVDLAAKTISEALTKYVGM